MSNMSLDDIIRSVAFHRFEDDRNPEVVIMYKYDVSS